MGIDVDTTFSRADIDRMDHAELQRAQLVVKLHLTELAEALTVAVGPGDEALRRRTMIALHQQRRLMTMIKLRLTEPGAQRRARRGDPEATRHVEQLNRSRSERLRAELGADSLEMLLVAAYRLVRHLLDATQQEELPETLDALDRETLSKVSLYLKDRHGRKVLASFIDDTGWARNLAARQAEA